MQMQVFDVKFIVRLLTQVIHVDEFIVQVKQGKEHELHVRVDGLSKSPLMQRHVLPTMRVRLGWQVRHAEPFEQLEHE